MAKFLLPVAIAFGLMGFGLPIATQQQDAAPPHAPDGGTRQRIESLTILPATNAPFSATVVTEWTRILPDGSTQVIKNHRLVARDSSGRIFQERRYFSPDGDKRVTRLSELDYEYPNRHEMYICRPVQRICDVYAFSMPASVSSSPTRPLANGASSVTHEDLGQKMIGELEALGSREITTINAGAIGNQRAEPIVKEFWYSPRLGINLVVKRFDPRSSAIQNFVMENVNLSEPDPKTFEPPVNYKIVRMDGQ